MTRQELGERLAEQRKKYSSWTYSDFAALSEPIREQFGEIGSDMSVSDDFYQVGVRVLERTAEYVLVGITVDDGRAKFGVLSSGAVTMKVYRDAREK